VNARIRKLLPWIGYPLFYVFALLLFFYLTFPYQRLKDRIVAEFNAKQTGEKPMRLEIDDMSAYWLSGVEADGVRLVSTAAAAAEGDESKTDKPQSFAFEELHARVSLLRLLVGITHISFGADAFGGSIDGYTSDGGDARTILIELEEVAVTDLPMLSETVGLPMTGVLSGKIDLKMPEGKLARAVGTIDLKITGLSVGDGKAKIRDTIALPKLDAGELVLQAEAAEGRLKVDKLSANGPDIELVSDGKIRLRDPFESSVAELNLRFKFSDTYKNKNDMTRGLFGAPGSSVPGVFDLDTKNRRAKRPDGFYGWRITGPMGHLNFDPAALLAGQGAAAPGGNPLRGFSPRTR
jgi:type II secretion system protein N